MILSKWNPNFLNAQKRTSSGEAPAPGTSDATFDQGDPGSICSGSRARLGGHEHGRAAGDSELRCFGVDERAARLRGGPPESGVMLKRTPDAEGSRLLPPAGIWAGDSGGP